MKNMKRYIEEFKKFAVRGNVIDLAVAVIIGGAFGKITTSLVDNIIMPLVGLFIGGIDFAKLTVTVGDANISYGIFIQNIVNFLIIAVVIFIVVKAINKVHRKEEKEEEKKAQEPSEEVKLLREIRDVLKQH
jgi:large conductance mechanosensitive channel